MEVKINVRGSDPDVVILKFPFSSVNVPEVVPFISIETEGTVSFVLLFLTLPVSVTFCENEEIEILSEKGEDKIN